MNRVLAAACLALSACVAPPDGASVGEAVQAVSSDDLVNPNPGIAPPGSLSFGKSYGQWAARYWQWALGQKAAVNPLTDRTGAFCNQGQRGDVFFLAGDFGGVTHRRCTVPIGKSLLIPILNTSYIRQLRDNGSVALMRGALRRQMQGAEVFASIDGREVVHPENYQEESPVFTVALPLPAQDNVLGFDASDCRHLLTGPLVCNPVVDTGFYLMLDPPAPGDHDLHFGGTTANGESTDITYSIHVQATP